MLTAVRIVATLAMLVFFTSGTAALLIDGVPSWLVLGSVLMMTIGGLLARKIRRAQEALSR